MQLAELLAKDLRIDHDGSDLIVVLGIEFLVGYDGGMPAVQISVDKGPSDTRICKNYKHLLNTIKKTVRDNRGEIPGFVRQKRVTRRSLSAIENDHGTDPQRLKNIRDRVLDQLEAVFQLPICGLASLTPRDLSSNAKVVIQLTKLNMELDDRVKPKGDNTEDHVIIEFVDAPSNSDPAAPALPVAAGGLPHAEAESADPSQSPGREDLSDALAGPGSSPPPPVEGHVGGPNPRPEH